VAETSELRAPCTKPKWPIALRAYGQPYLVVEIDIKLNLAFF
jgi:hypothetical protein